MRPTTRRAAVRFLLATPIGLGVGFAPLEAARAATCTCVTPDNCVCTGEQGTGGGEFQRQQLKELKKVQAGGLYTSQTTTFSNYDQEIRSSGKKTAAASPAAKGRQAGAVPRDEKKDLVPVTGLGTQNFGEASSDEARRKFAEIVKSKVADREKQLGFELDADDIRDLEQGLRVKYCGPTGLIGPC